MMKFESTSLNKLLFWSLVFHLLALFTFWSTQTSTPLIAGKALAGDKTLSVALVTNTSPVNSTPVNTKATNFRAREKSETNYQENNPKKVLVSNSSLQKIVQKSKSPDTRKVATIKPKSIKEKELLTRTKKPHEISTETAERLQASLGKQLSEYFNYPGLARKKGWQGQVKLKLRIEGNGHLSNIRLHKSSGYPSLDNAALHSLQEIAYLPDVRDWLQGMHYDIVVPVEYHLIDS